MSRGRPESLCQWMSLLTWIGMVVDAMLKSTADKKASAIYRTILRQEGSALLDSIIGTEFRPDGRVASGTRSLGKGRGSSLKPRQEPSFLAHVVCLRFPPKTCRLRKCANFSRIRALRGRARRASQPHRIDRRGTKDDYRPAQDGQALRCHRGGFA